MIWDCEQLVINSNPVILPRTFNSQLLAVEVSSTNQRNTWFSAGYLQSFALWDGRQFLGKKFKLNFSEQLIEIPYLNYQLQFQAEYWLENTLIKVQQLSTAQINSITNMGINFSVQPRSTGDMVDEVKTTGLTASQTVMAANPDRAEGGTIYNRTNKNMYVKWGIVAATNADLLVTAGSNIDVPESYTGAAQAICASGAIGQILTQTVSYV